MFWVSSRKNTCTNSETEWCVSRTVSYRKVRLYSVSDEQRDSAMRWSCVFHYHAVPRLPSVNGGTSETCRRRWWGEGKGRRAVLNHDIGLKRGESSLAASVKCVLKILFVIFLHKTGNVSLEIGIKNVNISLERGIKNVSIFIRKRHSKC